MQINKQFSRNYSKLINSYPKNSQLTTHNSQLISGFTLIELLIVIMIMALIFGLGFANYRDFQRRQVLDAAVRQLKGDLRFTQEQAISGRVRNDTPDNVCETSSLRGYYFRAGGAIPTTNYLIEANCVGGTVLIKSVNLSDIAQNVTISSMGVPIGAGGDPSPAGTIRFKVLGQGTNIARGSNATIRLCLNSPSPCARFQDITVSWSGEIR